jgi:two-component system, chemotaxis family, sensor kinase Cph1
VAATSSDTGNREYIGRALHDLKAGLRQVRISSELLKDSLDRQDEPGVRRMLDRIAQGTATIEEILSGMSQYAVADIRANYRFVSIPAEVPLRAALRTLDDEIQRNNAEITYQDLPEVWGDVDRLTEVFRQLIDNAITYRGAEDPLVHIRAFAESDHWIVTVRDNGVGIDPQFRTKLFTPFYRLHGPETPGVGLGLAICAKIVENHSGSIWIEPQSGPGAAVAFTLPKRDVAQAPQEWRHVTDGSRDLQEKHGDG